MKDITVNHAVFGPGRLTPDWLQQPCDDPWTLTCTDPDDPGRRDLFLGNGVLRQRLSVDGDAASYAQKPADVEVPGGCLMHGLWDEMSLMPAPRWAILDIDAGAGALGEVGACSCYRQTLNLKTATATTECERTVAQGKVRTSTVVRLCRNRPNVCIMERTATPDFDGTISFVDRIEAEFCTDSRDLRMRADNGRNRPMSLELLMGPRERRLAVVSRLVFEPGQELAISTSTAESAVSRTVRIDVKAGQTVKIVKIVAIVNDNDSPNPRLTAWSMVEGAALDVAGVIAEHEAAWAELWQGRVETPNAQLQKLLNATIYQLYANVGANQSWVPGPTGLSANKWGGRAFWDDELWMFPGLCLLQPRLGRAFAQYRVRTLGGARRNARAEGHAGAMFAWESTEFGDEAIPDLPYHHQHHLNSDIAYAQWFYCLTSGDDAYLKGHAVDIIMVSAEFWASWAEYNEAEDRYEIRRVCCADEFAHIQDNNAYTSYSAAWTLRLAAGLARKLGREFPEEWEQIADKIWIPFDKDRQLYIEYEGYNGETIKQADTAILIYPYEMPMPDQVKGNIVDYYRERYPEGNIMMSAAFDGIVDWELGRSTSGWSSLLKLLPHFRGPFLLASESPGNECISFQTGLGGFLQLILMGFAGVRVHDDGLMIQPCVPAEVGELTIRGLSYGGVRIDLTVDAAGSVSIGCDGEVPFRIYDRAGNGLV